jgi:hypothetical protein
MLSTVLLFVGSDKFSKHLLHHTFHCGKVPQHVQYNMYNSPAAAANPTILAAAAALLL